ncbi:hypothetical protein PSQ19_12700 [Devosia algicola]|uniref:Uncharacterized protein n=1 Tax=Devosia algicola TaxID=3026418 RepID=A0ABY7YK86_9HYPH|nr:hypothetical protein [Devosia algicola]WDR01624.1 hypothetical protein PSQ19_12700 [Devosia algicola]
MLSWPGPAAAYFQTGNSLRGDCLDQPTGPTGGRIACVSAFKFGSDAVLVMMGISWRRSIGPVILAHGLAIRPHKDDGSADGLDVTTDAIGERCHEASATSLDPRIEIGLGPAPYHDVEGSGDLSRFDQHGIAATLTVSAFESVVGLRLIARLRASTIKRLRLHQI